MKRYTILFFLFLLFGYSAHAQDLTGENIRSYNVTYVVNKDGSFNVWEKIEYDFDSLPNKHGIFRNIPYILTYENGKRYELGITIKSVTNEQGSVYNVQESRDSEFVKLKIGDPDVTVTGVKTYNIEYRVRGGLRYYNDHDEFFWNVNGFSWNVPVSTASVLVVLPPETKKEIKTRCFTGYFGSTETNCSAVVNGNEAYFFTNQSLSAGQNLSVAVWFPKGVVAVLEPKEVIPFSQTPLGMLVSLLGAILAIGWYAILPAYIVWRWYKYGRDPKVPEGPVSAWFSPPKNKTGRELTPGEVGTLIDENVQMRDIQAVIVDLARRGYLKIEERKKKDFYFVKRKPADSSLEAFEVKLLEGIFEKGTEIRLKDTKLYETIGKVQDMIYEKMVTEGFFPKNPKTIRSRYLLLTVLAFITGNIPLAASSLIFGHLMPTKTDVGAQSAQVAKSLKNFLSSQSRQLEFQAKEQYWFEKLLPYAVAFGVERVWAKRFEGIALRPPEWYSGYSGVHFTSASFADSLHSSMNSFASASTPPSSSSSGFSGGGFSGGGGGGGGGGSW